MLNYLGKALFSDLTEALELFCLNVSKFILLTFPDVKPHFTANYKNNSLSYTSILISHHLCDLSLYSLSNKVSRYRVLPYLRTVEVRVRLS